MLFGINVLIKTNNTTEYGYIIRQVDANLYEIYGDNSKTVYILRSSEFIELK